MNIWDASIVQRRQLTGEFLTLSLQFSSFNPFSFEPGQFVMMGLPSKLPWVLRKPYTILEGSNGRIERLLGSHSHDNQWLDEIREGSALDFIGPIGHAFDFSKVSKTLAILCEGEGIAAAYAVAKKAQELKIATTVIWLGEKTDDFGLDAKFLSLGLGLEQLVKVTTPKPEGDAEALNIFRDQLKAAHSVFISGSDAFINFYQRELKLADQNAQIAILPRDGCGVGVCLACVVKTKDGYRRACVSGPVFSSKDMVQL